MLLKSVLACFLIFGVFYLAGSKEVFTILGEISFTSICLLLAISYLLILVSCIKWKLFLQASGHQVSVHKLVKLYIIGYFVNLFLPSFLGGDAVRSIELGKELGNQKVAMSSTFAERVTGILAMNILGVFFVLIGSSATKGLEISILIVGFLSIVLSIVCFSQRWTNIASSVAQKVLQTLRLESFSQKVEKISARVNEEMFLIRTKKFLFSKAMFLSFCYHFLAVINTYIAAVAVGWKNPDLSGMFIVVPLALIVSMLPLTPSGIGIQEGAFLFFLERIGATKSQGLAVALILRVKVLIIAAFGAYFWLRIKGRNNSISKKMTSNEMTSKNMP